MLLFILSTSLLWSWCSPGNSKEVVTVINLMSASFYRDVLRGTTGFYFLLYLFSLRQWFSRSQVNWNMHWSFSLKITQQNYCKDLKLSLIFLEKFIPNLISLLYFLLSSLQFSFSLKNGWNDQVIWETDMKTLKTNHLRFNFIYDTEFKVILIRIGRYILNN